MTPRLATNQNKQITWRWEGEAFGETDAREDIDGDGNTTTINLRFPGQYYDKETGLHYNWFRDYNPQTGRYRQSDLIGLDGGLNTYGYAYQNPVMYVDPDGLDTYVVNRKIGGDTARPKGRWSWGAGYAHTYIVTTENGKITHTYSWGNIYDDGKTGWSKDRPEDMKAGQEAIDKGMAEEIGNESLDPYIERAYDDLKNNPNERWNLFDSCKHKAGDLLNAAINDLLEDACDCE